MPSYTITSSNSTADTWTTWATTDAGTNNISGTVWVIWSAGAAYSAQVALNDPPPRTSEQIAADEERAASRAQEAQEREATRAMASKRAKRLLAECLTAKQRRALKREDAFRVQIGERQYRIKRGYAGNVELVEGDRVRERYCIHPPQDIPDEDTMLAQKLLLEADEAAFLRVANATRVS